MVRYTVERHVFLYESYVKRGSARKCRRKFHRKFPRISAQRTNGIHKLINKVRSNGQLGHFWTRYLFRKPRVLLPKIN
jgi:hypothetical protein